MVDIVRRLIDVGAVLNVELEHILAVLQFETEGMYCKLSAYNFDLSLFYVCLVYIGERINTAELVVCLLGSVEKRDMLAVNVNILLSEVKLSGIVGIRAVLDRDLFCKARCRPRS